MAAISIRNMTRRAKPRVPFAAIARQLLPRINLSLAFVTPREARAINQRMRGKDYVPNVLSYPIGTRDGEIIICLSEAKKQAADFALAGDDFVALLFIHACLHLKGRVHGATMERRERTLLTQFVRPAARVHPHEPSHRNRHRHRDLPGQARRRRRSSG